MFSSGTQQRNRQDFFIRHAKEMRILSRSNTSDQCHRANFKSSVTRCTVQPFSMNRFRHKTLKTPAFATSAEHKNRHTPPRPLSKPSSACLPQPIGKKTIFRRTANDHLLNTHQSLKSTCAARVKRSFNARPIPSFGAASVQIDCHPCVSNV